MPELKFITVSEAENTPYLSDFSETIVPKDYVGIIPRKCECGADFLISTNRTIIKCSSSKCYVKIAWCATKLYRNLGIKGFGPETFKSVARERKCQSLLDILNNPPTGSGILLKEKLTVPRTWATCISMLGLPKLNDNAHKVFGGCNNIKDFCNKVSLDGGLYLYLKKRVGGDTLPRSLIDVISENRDILSEVENIFTIKPEASVKFKIAITGDITKTVDDNGNVLSQEGFLEYINEKLSQYSIQLITSKAYAQLIAVVADNPSSSEKYLAGKRRGILITSDRLFDLIMRIYEYAMQNKSLDTSG